MPGYCVPVPEKRNATFGTPAEPPPRVVPAAREAARLPSARTASSRSPTTSAMR